MARQGRTAAPQQQSEPFVQPGGEPSDAERVDPTRHDFDGESYAVEAPADLGNQRGIGIAELEVVEACCGPLDKKLNRGKGQRLGSRELGTALREGQRREPVHTLALGAKNLPARRQDVDPSGASQKVLCHPRGCFDKVLAIVEHYQQMLFAQVGDHVRQRTLRSRPYAEDARQCSRHQLRIGERGEIDEADSILEDGGQGVGDGDRDSRLADTTGPDNGDEALADHLGGKCGHGLGTADHACERHWQFLPCLDLVELRIGAEHGAASDRCDKAVAAPRNVGDVALAALAIAERAPQRGNVDL
ncbi:MAG: hypothetical protein WAS21_14210 [Geminicoccaceae bacterium]